MDVDLGLTALAARCAKLLEQLEIFPIGYTVAP